MPSHTVERTRAQAVACKEETLVQTFRDSLQKLDEWMVRSNTDPNVWEVIEQALLAWKEGQSHHFKELLGPCLVDAIHVQDTL